MPSLTSLLNDRFALALEQSFGEDFKRRDPVIRSSQFADFQANVALPLAKELKSKPRDIANTIVSNLDLADICETPEISGPGFINLTFTSDFLASTLNQGTAAEAVAETPATSKGTAAAGQRVVIVAHQRKAARIGARRPRGSRPQRVTIGGTGKALDRAVDQPLHCPLLSRRQADSTGRVNAG